jgi:AraC-like DNA-binding protein
MARPSHGNSVLLLRPLAAVLTRLGEDGDAFLDSLGVSQSATPDTYVVGAKVDAALEALARRRGDPTFSLTLAREAVVRPLGLYGHVIWLSGTMRDALTRAVRFYSLVSQRATLALAPRTADTAALSRRARTDASQGRILVEFTFASLVLRARAASGDRFAASEMRFAHGTQDKAPYEQLFGAKVLFESGADEMLMKSSMLDLPLASADPFTAEAVEAQARELLARAAQPEESTLADLVRDAVRAEIALARQPSRASVARALGLGDRSLGRRLQEEELSLRELVAEVQRERATELMAAGRTVKEVAFLLGFSEPSAFSRAFKRWTGQAPSASG